jgi:hypothetical protein
MNRSTALSKIPRRSLVALLCVAAAGGVFAQEDPNRTRTQTPDTPPLVERGLGQPGADTGVPPPSGPVKALTLSCCKCLGGTISYQLHTGTAPWKIVSGPVGPAVTVTTPHSLWATTTPAKWIGPSANVNLSSSPAGTYVYELRINMPKCIVPSSMTISGKYWGDDEAYMSVTGATGTATPAKAGSGGWGFQLGNAGSFNFTTAMSNTGGAVVLTVRVPNAAGQPSPTGLLVNGLVTQRCATEPIYPGVPGNPASSPI